MSRSGRWIVWMALGFLAGTAAAAEPKVFKYVDEKGNVVYSQTPPPDGREAKKIDASPAQGGRGGYTGVNRQYDDPRRYSSGGSQREELMKERQRKNEEAKQKRLAELEAECNRNRGTDCKNPETLRLMESQRIPGGRYYK